MKKVFLVIAILLSGFIAINMPVKIYAKDCGGVQVADKANCPGEFTVPGDGEGSLKNSVKKALSAIFGILGIIAAVVIIIAGVQYMISAGDPGKVVTAKKAILYAIIGLIVSLSAYAITNFILGAL